MLDVIVRPKIERPFVPIRAVRLARAALQTAFIVSDDLGASLAERLFTSPRRHARPERERAVLASGHPFAVDVALRSPRWHGAHVTVRGWRWGVGPTVLLVHGWEGRGSQLGAFVEPLVAAGLSVVAFDAPAHGDSPGHRLYLTDLADCIADVAAALGPLHAIDRALVRRRRGAARARSRRRRRSAQRDDLAQRRDRRCRRPVRAASSLSTIATAATSRPSSRQTPASASTASLSIGSPTTRDAGLLVVHDRDGPRGAVSRRRAARGVVAERDASTRPTASAIAGSCATPTVIAERRRLRSTWRSATDVGSGSRGRPPAPSGFDDLAALC